MACSAHVDVSHGYGARQKDAMAGLNSTYFMSYIVFSVPFIFFFLFSLFPFHFYTLSYLRSMYCITLFLLHDLRCIIFYHVFQRNPVHTPDSNPLTSDHTCPVTPALELAGRAIRSIASTDAERSRTRCT